MKALVYWTLCILALLLLCAGSSALAVFVLGHFGANTVDAGTAASLSAAIYLMVMLMVFGACLVTVIVATAAVAVARILGRAKVGTAPALVSLGIIAIAFPTAVRALVLLPLQFVGRASFPSATSPITSSNDEIRLSTIAEMFFASVNKVLLSTSQQLEQVLLSFPVPDAITAIAAWVAVALALSPVVGPPGRWAFVSKLGGMSPQARHTLAVVMALCLSGYLTIAAMVAIPWLEDGTTQPRITRESFAAHIDAAVSDIDLSKRYKDSATTAPFFSSLEQAITEAETKLAAVDPKPAPDDSAAGPGTLIPASDSVARELAAWKNYLRDLTAVVNSARRNRSLRSAEWSELRREAASGLVEERSRAIADFEGALLLARSTRERNQHIRDLARWLQDQHAHRTSVLDDWLSRFARAEANASAWEASTRGFLQRAVPAFVQNAKDRPTEAFGPSEYYYTDAWFDFSIPRFALRLSGSVRPQISEPGLGWGPFGWISKWLLRTESMALAMITGMLGFGLFGSVITAAIRHSNLTHAGLSLGALGLALMRGMSAAVVVFLAVKGGLAVIAQGDLNPNPYAMFFACFVGAVFSEDVWTAAREWFSKWRRGQHTPELPASPRQLSTGKSEGDDQT